VGYTPKFLSQQIDFIKSYLNDKNGAFGIDLLLPKIGEGARKTNYDYTKGELPELIKIICDSGAKLFVSAVGVPPRWAVDQLHKAGIIIMNMVGHPKHATKAMEAGVDLICAQGGEGGGHTGEIATSILIPKVVDTVKGHKSPLTGEPIYVVGAGGVFDGRGLAMVLSLGAEAAWVGTRFVCASEAGASPLHQQAIVKAGLEDTIRTIIFTGRPLRVLKTSYVQNWETNRSNEIRELSSKGVIPVTGDFEKAVKEGIDTDAPEYRMFLMGQAAGAVDDIKPAAQIINEMVSQAIAILSAKHNKIVKAKL
jgi:NAD(P)H-dependent flavin oxidoreductase YrpB (nitropropane dioxygenase family)